MARQRFERGYISNAQIRDVLKQMGLSLRFYLCNGYNSVGFQTNPKDLNSTAD
jgi:hypothetical protein